MIERYESSEISAIWSSKSRFEFMLKAEVALLKAMEGDLIPEGISKHIEGLVKVDPDRILEIEKETKHDVIAFCTSITEQLLPEIGKYFHYGVTSSDILDTALSLQIKESVELNLIELQKLSKSLKELSEKTKDIIGMGRSHGMYAEPLSFGRKWSTFYFEIERRIKDLQQFLAHEITGQFSGAVGNYTILNKKIEQSACDLLGVKVEDVSTQVIPRDRIAKLLSINALISAAIERTAVEIRHLHRSEVAEVFEGFTKGQKGSSTMPHKKNPISGENLSGLARVAKSHFQVALENSILWHERDISHSSAERMILPDNFGLIQYMTKRLTSTIENLVINTETIESRVEENTTFLSSFYLHELIVKTDLIREEIYPIVQKAAFDSGDFKDNLIAILNDMKIDVELTNNPMVTLKNKYKENF